MDGPAAQNHDAARATDTAHDGAVHSGGVIGAAVHAEEVTCPTGSADATNQPGHAQVISLVRSLVGEHAFEQYLNGAAHANLDMNTGALTVHVPTGFHSTFLQRRFGAQFREALTKLVQACDSEGVAGRNLQVHWAVSPGLFAQGQPGAASAGEQVAGQASAPAYTSALGQAAACQAPVQQAGAQQGPLPVVAPVPAARRSRPGWRGSSSRYKLDAFEIGESNRLAYDAAMQFANPGSQTHSPVLFLHGPCGVGKTHLLMGIASNYARSTPGARVLYTTGEQFTNEFVAAIQARKVDEFQRRYRELDLLCIDDIHFLGGNKNATQSEFHHTFEALELGGGRVVLASDAHPRQINSFKQSLVSRCLSGMVVNIQRPDTSVRRRIAARLLAARGLHADDQVLSLVADSALASVRELEGVVARVEAVARLLPGGVNAEGTVSLATVRRAINEGQAWKAPKPIRTGLIAQTVCEQLGVAMSEMLGPGRHRRVVLARSITAALARELTTQSFPEIARELNRQNHSTIVTACQRIKKQMEEQGSVECGAAFDGITLSDLVERLREEVRSRSRAAA